MRSGAPRALGNVGNPGVEVSSTGRVRRTRRPAWLRAGIILAIGMSSSSCDFIPVTESPDVVDIMTALKDSIEQAKADRKPMKKATGKARAQTKKAKKAKKTKTTAKAKKRKVA